VFGTGGDPVATGFVSSLARPEGNLTGVSYLVADLGIKRFDLMSQLLPQARIALLVNPQNANTERGVREIRDAAQPRGLAVMVVPATSPGEVDQAFALMRAESFDGFIVASTPVILPQRKQIVALAARHRLPALYALDEYVEAGGLLCYAPDRNAYYRRSAEYVQRILQGARPSDLPVEEPSKFELVINLRTAKALGLTIPPSLLARADQVIE